MDRPVSPVAPEQVLAAGWKLVPLEPTDAMTWAGQQVRYPATNSIAVIYRAMLAASSEAAPAAMEGCQRPNVACAAPECGADCRFSPAATPAAPSAGVMEAAELLAVAEFLGGAKDRLGRPDASANDQMRSSRAAIQRAAIRHGVAGGHHTYLDQCAAVLRAIAGSRK